MTKRVGVCHYKKRQKYNQRRTKPLSDPSLPPELTKHQNSPNAQSSRPEKIREHAHATLYQNLDFSSSTSPVLVYLFRVLPCLRSDNGIVLFLYKWKERETLSTDAQLLIDHNSVRYRNRTADSPVAKGESIILRPIMPPNGRKQESKCKRRGIISLSVDALTLCFMLCISKNSMMGKHNATWYNGCI